MKFSLRVRWGDSRPSFVSPLAPAARAVVLEPLFRPDSKTRFVDVSAPEGVAEVRTFRPAVLAGSLEKLRALPAEVEATHAVVIFTPEGSACASEPDRDALWEQFRVPVFEQVLAADGRLAAWECEAHDGLHLTEGAHAAPGSAVESTTCGCGLAGPRILRPLVHSRVAAA